METPEEPTRLPGPAGETLKHVNRNAAPVSAGHGQHYHTRLQPPGQSTSRRERHTSWAIFGRSLGNSCQTVRCAMRWEITATILLGAGAVGIALAVMQGPSSMSDMAHESVRFHLNLTGSSIYEYHAKMGQWPVACPGPARRRSYESSRRNDSKSLCSAGLASTG